MFCQGPYHLRGSHPIAFHQAGRAIQNLIQIPPDDKVRAILDVKDLKEEEFVKAHNIVLCTKKGIIKKTELQDFSRPRQSGVIAITINGYVAIQWIKTEVWS